MVSDVTISQALGQQANTSASTAKLAEDFSQFLTLLTVQLQNQDPLSPMETNEFTNQLVAFTGVEQQINTNQKLDNLVALGIGTAYSEAQGYIGKDISYISSEFAYTGAIQNIRYSLSDQASLAKINIMDEFGEVVYSTNAATSAGAHTFVWDGTLDNGGKATPGQYQVKIDALDAAENPVETTTVVTGKVRGTESQNGQIFLLVGERAVALSNVLNTETPSDLSNNNGNLTMALNYVGLDISYLNTELQYSGSGSADITYSLAEDADRAKVLIYNDSGTLVYSGDVPKSDGEHTFTWNGITNNNSQAPAGTYQFVIDALDESDQRIETSSIAEGNVTGVETQNGQIFLNVGNSAVNINNVLSANVPQGGSA